ncbi:MAG: SIS domain-containing protein [Longimicrobiales bacterium]|nr:SIS domain-containing protein [Longimicrobiales bacterium]
MRSPAVEHAMDRLNALSELAARAARDMAGEIAEVAEVAAEAVLGGRKLMFCGNGGSAADAQHLATEYVVRFEADRPALPALALTTDTSLLTAAANDFGFEHVFARQVDALGQPGDVLFLHSTSGRSPNLLRAAEMARERGVTTVAMLAKGGGELAGRVDYAVVLPTETGAHAQELHLAIGHIICELVEKRYDADRSEG